MKNSGVDTDPEPRTLGRLATTIAPELIRGGQIVALSNPKHARKTRMAGTAAS